MRQVPFRAIVSRAMIAVPLIISISLLVSTGPQVQEYIFALIYSDSPSIYGSSYQDTLIRFPELHQWLLNGLQWQFLLMATFIAGFSLRSATARAFFISVILTSFLSFIAYDGVIEALNRTFSAADLMEDLIADTFGAVLIGFVMSVVAFITNLCFVHVRGSDFSRWAVAAFVMIFIGVFLNAAAFFVAAFYYQPVPVKVDIVLDEPVKGMMFSGDNSTSDNTRAPTNDTEQDKQRRLFQLFPNDLNRSAVSWSSEAMQVQWDSIAATSTYDGTIEFFADCPFGQINTAESKEFDVVRVSNINELSASFDHGLSYFSTIDSSKISGRLAMAFEPPLFFWMDQDTETKQSKVTQQVAENTAITIWNDGHELAFYLYAPLLIDANGALIASSRTLHLKINEKTYLIEAAKPKINTEKSPSACKTLAPRGAIDKSQETITGSDSVFGVLIHINKRATSVYVRDDNELKVTSGVGWITIASAEVDESRRGEPGTVGFVGFKGNVASLEIDDSSTRANLTDEYSAFGEMTGSFESPTKIRFAGTAKALWKNGARANPTKWERLRWEQHLYVLGLTLGALGLILHIVKGPIQNDNEIEWLSSIRRNWPQ